MPARTFKPPTSKQVEKYAASLGKVLDGEEFCDYFEAIGWKVPYGKKMVPLCNWQAMVRVWVRSRPAIVGKNWKDIYLGDK